MVDIWRVVPTPRRPADKLAQFRNRLDLFSESGCGGRITFKYKDGSVVTIKVRS